MLRFQATSVQIANHEGVFLVGGEEYAVNRCRDLFDALASRL